MQADTSLLSTQADELYAQLASAFAERKNADFKCSKNKANNIFFRII